MAKILESDMTQFEQENLGIISVAKCSQRELSLLIKNELAPLFAHFENAKFYNLSNGSVKTFFIFIDTGLVPKKGLKTGYLITCFKFFEEKNGDGFSIIHLFKSPIVNVKDKDLTLI